MAELTEAACLLESGALYTRRAGYQGEKDPIFLGVKHGAFSLYFGDAPYYHFDLDGRWQRALIDGVHYLKGLDTVVRAIDRVREGANLVLKRRTLSYAETSDLDEAVRRTALDLIAACTDGSFPRLEPPVKKGVEAIPKGDALDLLERVAGWDAAAWFAHRERYLRTYGPLPFVPPAFLNPVIVQATIGRSRGLAFGGGVVEPFAARSADEFLDHVRLAAETLGRRSRQSRRVFLAGDEIFRLPAETVESYLLAVNEVFPIVRSVHRGRAADGDLDPEANHIEGIGAFLDDFGGPTPTADQWAAFRALNLDGVTLGIESGDPETLARLGRDWTADDVAGAADDLRRAGLRVDFAVIANLGGAAHREATAALLESARPGKGEVVSLLDVREFGGTPDDANDWDACVAEWRTALAGLKDRGAKVVGYSLEKRWN